MSINNIEESCIEFFDLKDEEAELISGGSYQSIRYSQNDYTVIQVFGPGGVKNVFGTGNSDLNRDDGSILIIEF